MSENGDQDGHSIESKKIATPVQCPQQVKPKENITKILQEITASPDHHRLPRKCHKNEGYAECDEEMVTVTVKPVTVTVKSAVHVEMVKFAKDDWITSNTYDRGVMLSILLIGHDYITDINRASIKDNDWKALLKMCFHREPQLHNIGIVNDIPRS